MDLHPSGPGLLCRALRGVLRLRACPTLRHDSDVDEADPTAPLFVAILRLGIIYVILASGILLANMNAVDPCISLARVGQHGANDHRLGALLNTLVVAHGLAAIEWAIRRGAFGWVIVGAGAAVGFCWIIGHSETVPTDFRSAAADTHHWNDHLRPLGRWTDPWRGSRLRPTAALALFYGSLAPKILFAPLRDAPQSGFARYYIPAILKIDGGTARLMVMQAYCPFSLLVHWSVGSKFGRVA